MSCWVPRVPLHLPLLLYKAQPRPLSYSPPTPAPHLVSLHSWVLGDDPSATAGSVQQYSVKAPHHLEKKSRLITVFSHLYCTIYFLEASLNILMSGRGQVNWKTPQERCKGSPTLGN